MWALAGCDGAAVQERPFGIALQPPIHAPWVEPPQAASEEAAPSSDAERRQLEDTNKLLDEFGQRAPAAFMTEEAAAHLPGLERFYFATGRYLELVDIYRTAYDAHGPGHFVAPRLAWAYLTLGDDARASEVLDAAMQARPNDAWVHFTYGYMLGMRPTNDPEVGRAVYRAWSKALELDPAFVGPQGVTAERLRGRLEEMAKLLRQQGIPLEEAPKAPEAPEAPGGLEVAPVSAAAAPPAEDAASGDARLLEAESLLASGKANEAGKLFDALLQTYPQSQRADVGRALAAWRSETVDRQDAEKMLRHVTQRPDLSGRQCYELGVLLYRELKDRTAALALWRQAAARDPGFAAQVRLEETIGRVAAEP